jgi:hypothetical protein
MATYKALVAQKEAIEAQLAELRANEAASVIENIRGLMADYGWSVEDIAGKASSLIGSWMNRQTAWAPRCWRWDSSRSIAPSSSAATAMNCC